MNHVAALLNAHHATLVYAVPVLYIGALTMMVKWVLRGPRDMIIDIHYLPETLTHTGRSAHQADLRSRFC